MTAWTAQRCAPRLARAAFALVLATSGAGAAHAQTAPPSTSRGVLRVEAPERCAAKSLIAARVHERSARIQFVDDAVDAPLLRVVLHDRERGDVSAELRIEWPDGRRSVRSLSAASCEAAADALALLITLTLDPSAQQAPAETDSESDSGSESESESDSDSDSESETEAASASETEAEAEAEAETESASESEAASASEAEAWGLAHVAVGVALQGVIGPTPRAMPGVGLSALVAWNGFGWWAPLVQVRVARSWSSSTEAGGVADFRLDAAHVVACPVGLRTASLAARACVAGALGSLLARGSDTYDPESHGRLWASAGAELLLSADLVGPLQLQAGAGLAFPLRRDRFAFAPAIFHRVAPVCFQGQLGLALRFP